MVVLTKLLQFEWSFVQRVFDEIEDYVKMSDVIRSCFITSILGREVNQLEVELFHLPARLSGLGISDPVKSGELTNRISVDSNIKLSDSIRSGNMLNIVEHNQWVK